MNTFKKSLVLALLAGIGFSAVAQERVYAIDGRDVVVKSGYGLCWRTGYWTPAAAAAAPGVKPSGEKVTVAADALFDFNKAVLRPEGKAKLDEVVAKSKAIKLEVILAVGHTDRIGSDSYNQKLSEKRAAAVKEYLVAKGIEANRVYIEVMGTK